MVPYLKSAEFWQCVVFLAWSIFELIITCVRIASVGRTALLLGLLLLISGAFFLLKAFVNVVQWRLKNPGGPSSAVARVFLYSAGTLALALQTVWYVAHGR